MPLVRSWQRCSCSINMLDMQFLHGCPDPTLAIISMGGDGRSLNVYKVVCTLVCLQCSCAPACAPLSALWPRAGPPLTMARMLLPDPVGE